MKIFLLAPPLVALSLSGCAALQMAGITPASAPALVAISAETAAGAQVIRAEARGDRLAVRLWCFRIRQAREGFNATAALQLGEEPKRALARSRDLTEGVCEQAGVSVALPSPAAVPEVPDAP